MIRGGPPINVRLGHGDSTRPNLLGGTFGDASDSVGVDGGFGARFFPNAKEVILRAAQQGYGSTRYGFDNPAPVGGGANSGGPRRNPLRNLK